MMRADERSLDVSGFVFVLHFVECRADGFFQCLFVVRDEYFIKTHFFLKVGSAPMLTLCAGKGDLDGLLQLDIFNILCLRYPLCFFIKSIIYARFHKFLYNSLNTFANV